MRKRIHVFYSGRVQGVGFRFATEDLALELEIVGWVKNLRDGRVEIIAEQEEDILKRFLEKIRSYFSGYIHNIDLNWEESTGEFGDYRIRF